MTKLFLVQFAKRNFFIQCEKVTSYVLVVKSNVLCSFGSKEKRLTKKELLEYDVLCNCFRLRGIFIIHELCGMRYFMNLPNIHVCGLLFFDAILLQLGK